MVRQSKQSQEKNIALNPINATSVVATYQSKGWWIVLKSGLLYFAIVFAVGFVLGSIRLLWAVPHFGTRVGELMEMPLMFIAIMLAARWVIQRLAVPSVLWARLGMGLIALGCLVSAEFGVVLWLRGLSITEYWATRDPVSGNVYLLMLGVFAATPWVISRSKT